MLEVQRLAIDNIYCAPGQDRQFSFHMVRVNKPNFPAKRQILLYNTPKQLPNSTSLFHVFVLGNIPPQLLNLLTQQQHWFKDTWIRASEDMVARDYILKVYNDDGVMFPRQHIYYSYIDQNSLVVALEVLPSIRAIFPVETFKYLHVYSNAFFSKPDYANGGNHVGIDYLYTQVANNQEKVNLQNAVAAFKSNGGDVFIYVNGYWTDHINLNIPDTSYVEIVYDQSVQAVEHHLIASLRTFDSIKDDKLKYLIYRDSHPPYIRYQDDAEVYVTTSTGLVKKGLFLYKHQPDVMRNVTDKDYSLTSSYVNTTAQALSSNFGGSLADKVVTIYIRKSGRDMPLLYSSLKLHELYKLPADIQKDVMSSNSYSTTSLRAETLENSKYFRLASSRSMTDITGQLAADVVGYNGVTHYLADTPVVRTASANLDVAELYQMNSLAFEYDTNGLYTGGMFPTAGPLYTCSGPGVKYVDFMYGYVPNTFGQLYEGTVTVPMLHPDDDYAVLAAYHSGNNRESAWEVLTNTPAAVKVGGSLQLTIPASQKVKIIYLNQLNIYDLQLSTENGLLYFPLTVTEDRGTGSANHVLDVPPQSLRVYLNKRRLTQGLDFFVDFPYICITSKKYLRTDTQIQDIHIRMSGYTLDPTKINALEVRGFVNNGALTRNKRYDIRDDRVFSVYVDGQMKNRSEVIFSETDNTVRLSHPLNGLPYVLDEGMIPVKKFTGVPTEMIFAANQAANAEISSLFNLVFPEPAIEEFNAISGAHRVYSPVVSKLIVDILSGVIPSSVYTTPYDDGTIHGLLSDRYKALLKVDPIKHQMPDVLVEIHPHPWAGTVDLTLYQYRFISNFIRVLTSNNPTKINISGLLTVST